MQIKDIFAKNLYRSINGVVKAEQQDQSVVWQELEEYVVTRELLKHFQKLFQVYLKSIDQPQDPSVSGQIGVWISGFFGSGKSHFIKILSYLLSNKRVGHPETGTSKNTLEFFKDKLEDSLFLGDIQRAVSQKAEVILFNIDTKADHKEGRNAILNVFLRVFNENQGFSGDYPHIAQMESYLSEKGRLEAFHQAFQELDGSSWQQEKDAHLFKESQVVGALAKALEISEEDAQNWFNKAENQYSLTIENFAKQVKSYLDRKGPQHRILFLVDEVGQFIGDDSPLMLNLQTITENLGTICGGRAWVMVTSQEDIDTVLGEFKRNKEQDFSKIQGRFTTRLSLSSSNTDEVIQKRLLTKTPPAETALKALYAEKGDILKHQLSFINTGATLKNYADSESFVANYPFIPYQFQLLQKVFESIRKAGATGKHLSRGERSMLDAFQLAAQESGKKPIGALVPLYQFYPAIEGFLDTAVSRTINQAADRPLELFDLQLLRVLFLIRYVDILKPNIDNLITLCIDQVDADRLILRRKIEESLQRLERETLISRSGDLFYFLTNEEQDITREIKLVSIDGNEETQEISRLIFEEVLKGNNNYRYPLNKTDYPFTRLCDGHPWKGRSEQDLVLEVITPFSDDYDYYLREKCITRSIQDSGRAVVKLANPLELPRELRIWLQTDKYIRAKSDTSAPPTLQRILRDRQEENRERQKRLIQTVTTLLQTADYYAMGKSLELKASSAQSAMDETVKYLLENLYSKLRYLKTFHPDPQEELKAILRTNDVTQIEMVQEPTEQYAMDEVRLFIQLKNDRGLSVSLQETIDHFSARPFGWPEWEIAILVARLAALLSINLMQGTSPLTLSEAREYFCKPAKWKLVTLHKRRVVDQVSLDKSRKLGQQLFGQIGPDAEKDLFDFLKQNLTQWKSEMERIKLLIQTGKYPGESLVSPALKTLSPLLSHQDSFPFIGAFLAAKQDLENLSEDLHDLRDFYQNQKSTWERLLQAHQQFGMNQKDLQKDPKAASALQSMEDILNLPHPYNRIKEVDGLIATLTPVNEALIQAKRQEVDTALEQRIGQIKVKLEQMKADPTLSNRSLKPLQDFKKQIQSQRSLAEIHYALSHAQEKFQEILEELDRRVDPKKEVKPPKQISLATLAPKPVLETDQDIDELLEKLRQELKKTIANQERIRII
ncbi:MAG: BREX system P-loop protein BrxC [SAR324 cluster bacterium]|nr:BREX system P-loop protein BrxC [SAR324 cluster bacterium]